MKYCIKCRWYWLRKGQCTSPGQEQEENPVFGWQQKYTIFAKHERVDPNGRCGPEGKLYEPKGWLTRLIGESDD